MGDGGTTKGIDESNTIVNTDELFKIHMPAYLDSISKGVSTIMVSYSSLNGTKMHANHDLITGYLKNTLGFKVTTRSKADAHPFFPKVELFSFSLVSF